ncbi:MAG TPA: hypothetical protein DDX14_00925 [Cyanobacteria bacterium UBA9579]|nr:hypothetical protein [Cyanobacteria bacterium UBA9579]
MNKLKQVEFLKRDAKRSKKQAATMVEYLLVISLVSVFAIGALIAMQGHMKGVFTGISDKLQPVNQVLQQNN